MATWNKKRVTKQERQVATHMTDALRELVEICAAAGLPVSDWTQLPRVLDDHFSGGSRPVRGAAQTQQLPVAPAITLAPVAQPRPITATPPPARPSVFGIVDVETLPPDEPEEREEDWFPGEVAVPAIQAAAPRPTGASPPSPTPLLDPDAFQRSLEAKIQAAERDLASGRPIHGAAGGGLPRPAPQDDGASPTRPTSELTPVEEQRVLLARALGRPVAGPPPAGMPNMLK